MAVTWGSTVSGLRVGIDISVSGTTVTVRYYVGAVNTGWGDDQILNLSGSLAGAYAYYMDSPFGGDGVVLVVTRTFTATPGVLYTMTAQVSGAWNGANPIHTRTYQSTSPPPTSGIYVKTSSVTWQEVQTVYLKTTPTSWTIVERVYLKQSSSSWATVQRLP
jgi:hypothetical protein